MILKANYRAVLQVAICIATLSSVAAFANVSASAYIEDERSPLPSTPDPVTGSVTAVQTSGAVGSSQFAWASADAGTGVLKAAVQAGLDGPYLLPATAATQVREDISFSSGFGGTAYLDWSFDGNITLSSSPYNPQFGAAFGQFNIYAATVFGSDTQYTTLSPFPYACGVGCVLGTSVERTGTVAIPINEYGATIIASLSTFATYGNFGDFGNTSKLYLRLPDGVTFTSTSGHFLENAEPIFTSSVPETSTYALLLVGLVVVCGASRQRPQQMR